MKLKKRLNSKDGYLLAWVLVCTVVVMAVSTVALSAVVVSNNSTLKTHEGQQAYFTAKSAASAVADYIMENCDTEAKIMELVAGVGTGSYEGLGDYSVKVSYVTADKLRITASGTYRGETATVKLYLIKQTVSKAVIPTDNVVYVNDGKSSSFQQGKMYGSVYINGDFAISNSSNISEKLVVNGNAKFSGDGVITNDLVCLGNAIFEASGRITGSAIVGGNVSFSGGSNHIAKNLSYVGNVTCSYGSISTFVSGTFEKISSFDSSKYTPATLPIISAPNTTPDGTDISKPVSVVNKTISSSGTINSSVLSTFNSLGYGTKITIDTSSKDIYLLLNNVPFTASKGVQFIATGPYNVYIYMTGSSSISLTAGGQYLGGKISGATPNVFVFGDAQQTVALNGCELDAVVYIPLGKMTVSNYALSTCIFFGSSVVKTFNIANDVSIKYVAPVIVGTPLSVLTGGGSDFANWAIEGWDS